MDGVEIFDETPEGFPGYATRFSWPVSFSWMLIFVRVDEGGWPTRDRAAPEEEC